jgi:hypothetical protein
MIHVLKKIFLNNMLSGLIKSGTIGGSGLIRGGLLYMYDLSIFICGL